MSFDGFRWDYLDVAHNYGQKTPNFDRLVSEGVSIQSPGIRNAFITKTMPNHYTIVTGLYEENHGIVANTFYDPVFNDTFDMTKNSSLDIKWWRGTGEERIEPIWVTNDHHGDEHHVSGVFFWPGSEVPDFRPHHTYGPFNISVPFETRADTVVGWFTQHRDPINFGAMYYHEPDATGHKFGPLSQQVAMKIAELDGYVGYLIEQLEKAHLFQGLNLIITSDHGMQLITRSIHLDDYVDPALYTAYGDSPVLHIVPKEGHLEEIYNKLKPVKNLIVYKKEEVDPELHYKNNRRIMPLVVAAAEGFRLCKTNDTCDQTTGNHGYDNRLSSMHPIFIAHGPAFKKEFVGAPFNSVDIYPLLCRLLGIEPQLNDGSFVNIKHILSDGDDDADYTYFTFLLVGVFCGIIAVAWCFGAWRSQRVMIRPRGLDSPWRQPTLATNNFPLRTENRKPLLESEDDELA